MGETPKMILSGPMFESARDEFRRSIYDKAGGHYNVFATLNEDAAMKYLRSVFPDGEANALNFVLFSTSGMHGTYTTLEEVEVGAKKYGWGADPQDPKETEFPCWPDDFHGYEVTFLVVQPRLVTTTHGNVIIHNREDLRFLKKIRASSWRAVRGIGRHE